MMASIAKLLASVAAASLLFSACTKVGTESAGGAGGHPWTHHGVLRMANLSEPDTLNPIVGNQQIDSDLAQLWGGYFFNWSDQNEYVPELATEVPTLANKGISADGKTIVYHLRRGVLWHDGETFSADDVLFTFHAIMNKKNNVPSTVGYELITAIDIVDPYTIRVHLKQSYAPFVASFFNQSGNPYPVLPAHILAKYPDINRVDFNSQPIGTGPFKMERWARGSKISFVANPKYWRGPPKLQRFEYNPVPNENTIIAQLQSHDIDIEYNASTTNFPQYSKIPGTTVIETPFTSYAQLGLNLTGESGVLADVRVRKALWYALDTHELITKITHDVNMPGYTDQPEFLWAYNPKATHYPFDPAKAKALLDEAGWTMGPDGIRAKAGTKLHLTFATSSGSATGNAVAVVAQRAWRDVGIDMGVKTYPTSLFFASYGAHGILQTGKFDVGFYAWINGTDPDDSTLWMCDQFPPHGQNIYHFCNKDLDAAELVAISNNDRAARKAAYDKIQAILSDQVPAIITWYNRRVAVANTDLKGYRPAHAVSSFWNSYEWEI